MSTNAKRYKPNDGWFSAKLPIDIDAKLRELARETKLKLTTIVSNGIEAEWKKWKSTS